MQVTGFPRGLVDAGWVVDTDTRAAAVAVWDVVAVMMLAKKLPVAWPPGVCP